MHIALIPDGNRRYSKSKGLPLWHGHKQGFRVMKSIIEHIDRKFPEITEISLYAMSKDNLEKRSDLEVKQLWNLYTKKLTEFDGKFGLNFIGDKTKYPRKFREKLEKLKQPENGKTLNILLVYNGEPIGSEIQLVIRTGNAQRLSGFPVNNYTLIRFRQELFPEYSVQKFEEDYQWFLEQDKKQNFGK